MDFGRQTHKYNVKFDKGMQKTTTGEIYTFIVGEPLAGFTLLFWLKLWDFCGKFAKLI